MSVGSGLHAGEIDCLVSRLVDEVRWLWVFARDELPDFAREIRPWCLILNTDPKDQPGTHWLAFYALLSGDNELFDSFGFAPSMYSLDLLDPLNSSYSFKSPNTSVCGHYCIVYIYLSSHNYLLSGIVHLLTDISSRDLWVKQYIYNIANSSFHSQSMSPYWSMLQITMSILLNQLKCKGNEINEMK